MEHSGLNFVDLAVLSAIILSGLLALFRGFVRELLSLGAWIGATLITVYFYPVLRPWMHEHIKNDFTADALTGIALFCGTLALLIPIGYFLGSLIRGQALTAIDRSLGFVFGLARGVLVVCLLFLLTLWVWPTEEKEPKVLAEARTRPLMVYGAEALKSLIPQDQMKKAAEQAAELEKSAKSISIEDITHPGTAAADTTTGGKTPTVDSALPLTTTETPKTTP